jgi:hypothetical protein
MTTDEVDDKTKGGFTVYNLVGVKAPAKANVEGGESF